MDVQDKIINDEDFANLKRYDFSIKKVLERYPNGAPVRLIAQALGLTPDEVTRKYKEIVIKLRTLMGFGTEP